MITTAFINIWNKRVGAIAWDTETELGFFEFEPSFLRHQIDLSPLKMPIDRAEKNILLSRIAKHKYFQRLARFTGRQFAGCLRQQPHQCLACKKWPSGRQHESG